MTRAIPRLVLARPRCVSVVERWHRGPRRGWRRAVHAGPADYVVCVVEHERAPDHVLRAALEAHWGTASYIGRIMEGTAS